MGGPAYATDELSAFGLNEVARRLTLRCGGDNGTSLGDMWNRSSCQEESTVNVGLHCSVELLGGEVCDIWDSVLHGKY